MSSTSHKLRAQAASILFASLPDLAKASELIRNAQSAAAAHGSTTRSTPRRQIVCRPNRKEAEDLPLFAEEQADEEALEYSQRQKSVRAQKELEEAAHYKQRHANRFPEQPASDMPALFPGMHASWVSPMTSWRS